MLDDVAVGRVIRIRLDADKVASDHKGWRCCEFIVEGKSFTGDFRHCTQIHLTQGCLMRTRCGSWFFRAPTIAVNADLVQMFGAPVVSVEVPATPDDVLKS